MAKTMSASDVKEPVPEEKPLPNLPEDCREVLAEKKPEVLAAVDDVAERVRMFGQTTQKTVDEAKRRIESMVTQTTPTSKGESVPVHHHTGSATATFTPKDPGSYRVQYQSPPPGPNDMVVQAPTHPFWTLRLKKKHRKEAQELNSKRTTTGLSAKQLARLIKLEKKAHKRAKKKQAT